MHRFFPRCESRPTHDRHTTNCPHIQQIGTRVWRQSICSAIGLTMLFVANVTGADIPAPIGTQPFTMTDDPAAVLVDGVDRFLLRQIDQAKERRLLRWKKSYAEKNSHQEFITAQRAQLTEILGIRGSRIQFHALELVDTTSTPALVTSSDSIRIERVRWPVLTDPDPHRKHLTSVTGEGLLLTPITPYKATIIAIPDADQTPEQLCGLADGILAERQYARQLAEAGFRVIVPAIISRHVEARNGRGVMTDREFIYRGSFILGQHLIGYELQKVLALVDMIHKPQIDDTKPIGIIGYGEGGMLSLFAAALDHRISSAAVSGYFGPREHCWQEPLDRNVFGLLNNFGAAQLAAMIAPRPCVVETANVPEFEFSKNGGAPAALTSPQPDEIQQEARVARELGANLRVTTPQDGQFGSSKWIQQFVSTLDDQPGKTRPAQITRDEEPADLNTFIEQRRLQQLQELDRHNQALLRESPFVRKAYMSKLDTSSVHAFETSAEPYRETFRKDIIGQFDEALLPPNARSRKLQETELWTAYEIWLDVFPDVGAYGVLLLPKNLEPNERRPVVVCQHGLEGRPVDTFQDDHRAYHDYAAKLCEQGFITFAPQNIYIFEDRFRTLQRKANPLGKTLFSVIVPQHQQIINWLKSQPYVDGDRIAFYGLSYGGKSAMRIPALVTDYCLSICSADFSEWVLKNASTRHNFSYVWTGEYEIFEWNLGRTFNYSEMAALICPRPFMVERGHFDGVGEDNWVAHEFAKVRHLYAAKLKIPERTEIEWFDGPHTINGNATFDFLHRHLNWKQ